jgi:hypothetical protein
MSDTIYKGNKNTKRKCCVECAPELEKLLLLRKKIAVERVRLWRTKLAADNIDLYRRRRADEAKIYSDKNREKVRSSRRAYAARNRCHINKYSNDYSKTHPWINRNAASKRRAARFNRTPVWADLIAIKNFYKNCPEGKVVDHVIPLRGKLVSGLHVHNNLQYLSDSENSRKNNKYPYELVS